jgi:hypothetical protein
VQFGLGAMKERLRKHTGSECHEFALLGNETRLELKPYTLAD